MARFSQKNFDIEKEKVTLTKRKKTEFFFFSKNLATFKFS